MKCIKCGNDLIDTGLRCSKCGTQFDLNNNPITFMSPTATNNYDLAEVK